MLGYEFMINDRAALQGRSLEPWRAILAVALWLQDGGVSGGGIAGLFDRMNRLSVAY